MSSPTVTTPKTVKTGAGKLIIGEPSDRRALEAQVTAATLKPSVNIGDPRPVLSGAEIAGDRKESWTIEVKLLADLGQTNSISEWLFTHRGQEQPFIFVPNTVAGKQFSGRLMVETHEFGGNVGESSEPSVEFRLIGAPTLEQVSD